MTKLTTERLETIATWRETYGNGANVMIPAEEAELMARQLLAYEQAAKNEVALPEALKYAEIYGRAFICVDRSGSVHAVDPSQITLNILNEPESAQPVSEPYKLPSGFALVPCKLTAENGAKSCMIGEFTEQTEISCPECFGDDGCETCDGSGMIEVTVPVSWTTIKDIWVKGIEHFAAAADQEQKS